MDGEKNLLEGKNYVEKFYKKNTHEEIEKKRKGKIKRRKN